MRHLLLLSAAIAFAASEHLLGPGLGKAEEVANPSSTPITEKILERAKQLSGDESTIKLTRLFEIQGTQYSVYTAELEVDGKTCSVKVADAEDLKFIEDPVMLCILCC